MAAEARAVERLREALETCSDFQEKVSMLSIKVKWGQEDMKDISTGNLRQFLTKYPDVFTCDGVSVKLTNPPAPLTTAKGKAPPPAKASFGPKAGIVVPKPSAPAVPKKRGFGDLAGADDSDAKAGRYHSEYDDPMHPSSPPGLDGGRPTSKAAAFGAGDKGGCKGGKDNGKSDKGYAAKGKFKGNPFEEAEEDIGMESYEGDKGGKNGKDSNGKGYSDKGQPEKGFKGGKGKGDEYGKGVPIGAGKGDDYGKGMPPSGAPTSKAKWGGSKPPQVAVSPEERKRALLTDSPQSEANRGIESFKSNGTEIELSKLSSTLLPSDEVKKALQRCMALLLSTTNQLGSHQNGAPAIELYGSYAQGTELQGSAVDVALRLPAEISSEDKDSCIRLFRERLHDKQNFFEVFETMQHYPHTESPVSVELKGATPRLVVNIVVTPKPADRSTKLDSVIKQLCDSHEDARALIRLVKLWSVNHGLDKHRDGYMNGVAWALFVLFFLQQQKLVPPYSALSQNPSLTPSSSQMSLATLLFTFFDFLAKRGATELRGISVYSGEQFSADSIFIEDPAHFEDTRQQQSLSSSLTQPQWTRCVEEAKKAANRIGVRPQRWFHWAEVFDPSERINVKHPGLAQWLAGVETVPQNDPAKGGDKGKGAPAGKGKDSYGMGDAPIGGKDPYGKGKDSMDGKGKDGLDGKGKDSMDGKGKDSIDGKGKDSMDGKGKEDFFGKGKSKDDSFGKGKDDSFCKGKDDFGKGKDDAYGKGKDDSYGKGKDDYQDAQDSYGKGKDKDGSCGKGKDYSSSKGKESYGKGKDMSYGKGDDYSYKGKGGKPY